MVPGRAKRSEPAGAEGIVGFISSYCESAALPDTATSECVIDFLPSQYENLWTSCGGKNKNKSRQARYVSYWHEKKPPTGGFPVVAGARALTNRKKASGERAR